MYTVIEYTQGYMPDDDDPPVFDQWNEALYYVNERRREIIEDDYSYSYPPEDKDGDPVFELEMSEVDEGEFHYYDKRQIHPLARIVEIVPYEEELDHPATDEEIERSFDAYR